MFIKLVTFLSFALCCFFGFSSLIDFYIGNYGFAIINFVGSTLSYSIIHEVQKYQ